MRPFEVVEQALIDLGINVSFVVEDSRRAVFPSAVIFTIGKESSATPSGRFEVGDEFFQVELRDRPGRQSYTGLVDTSEGLMRALAATGRLSAFQVESDNGFESGIPSNIAQTDQLLVRICTVGVRS